MFDEGMYSQTVVRLAVEASGARALAEDIASWLVTTGIATPNPHRTQLYDQRFLPGPACHRVVDDDPPVWVPGSLGAEGVDVHSNVRLFWSGDGYVPPHCVRCGVRIQNAVYLGHIQRFWDAGWSGGEPLLRCSECGWEGLLGDWPGEGAFGVGAPAVEFYEWPPLKASFLAEVQARLGGRTKVVLRHT